MVGFLKTAAIELAKYNITVNAVAPGSILTEGLSGIPESKLEKMKNVIPMKRLGSPEEIAHTVAFLASQDASFITGQNIVVDGGQTLPEIQTADF
jgi:3-oxoacyl-[acyl-carrier protein] reductase